MIQISLKQWNISILFMLITSFIFASEVHAKSYAMAQKSKGEWSSRPLSEKGVLGIVQANILIDGTELKNGLIVFTSSKFGKANLKITDAFLGKGGVFNCKGVLQMNGEKKELFFDVNLELIEKGFNFKSRIDFAQEDFNLKLYKKSKKAYDDVSFTLSFKLSER